KNFDFWV
nr:Chain E, peptide [synthetic construct]6UBH_F Chain F, peptide [synthetic construct]6UBH_G Chain G, peptide [synthetic construct]6UBH_H Chain H, peptide [synthetic construct]